MLSLIMHLCLPMFLFKKREINRMNEDLAIPIASQIFTIIGPGACYYDGYARITQTIIIRQREEFCIVSPLPCLRSYLHGSLVNETKEQSMLPSISMLAIGTVN